MFIPIAIILKTDMEDATNTMRDIAEYLSEIYGEGYGVTIYDGGSVIPTIAFFNDHDEAEVEVEDA